MREASRRGDAIWPLRALVAATIILPLLVLAGGSYLAWRNALADAIGALQRDLDVSVEHATRVFDAQMLLATAVNDLVGDLDDATLIAREAEFSERIRGLIARFPQVTTATVISAEGRPLVSASTYPVDRTMRYDDRDYFQALRDNGPAFFIGALVTSRHHHRQAFSLARRKGNDPERFAGVVVVAVSATYFHGFDRALLGEGPDYIASVVRADGAVLARYPQLVQSYLMAQPGDPLMQAVKQDPIAGIVRSVSLADGADRVFVYRRLADYPVYVTVGQLWSSVVAAWRDIMLEHLLFGIPASFGLLTLSVMALRRARRESAALAALRAEAQRRQEAEDTLRQAQKMEAVGRLTGGIAHDFNNHLMVISSNVELLRRRLTGAGEPVLRLCDAALLGVQRAATVTSRLLAFSRRQPLDPQPLDAGRLVAGMSELLHATLGETVTVETALADGLWPVRCDANQLENALLNLAVNARDAMPNGGTLTIRTANVELDGAAAPQPGAYVMIAVIDTGAGMTQDVMDRAFEPFFTTKPKGQGTGLGLSMVYGFISQSGGHVTIRSEPGKGTAVTLYLPHFLPDAAAAAAREQATA